MCGWISWGVVPLAGLLSAEVGGAPPLLPPADLTDEFLLVLNLRGSYLYRVRLVPLGTPRCQRPSQQNICSPLCGSRTAALMEGRGELQGWQRGLELWTPHLHHIHSFMYSIQYTEVKECMAEVWSSYEKRAFTRCSEFLFLTLTLMYRGYCTSFGLHVFAI